MSLAPPTVAELATFKGREPNTFGAFAVQALAQATLLFALATGLDAYPDDPNLTMLAKNGIMDMADSIYLSQPYQEAAASPFQSESIGSYSYSKTVRAVKRGEGTGIMWFDLAVSKMKSARAGVGATGSIEGMEWDGVEVGPNGRARVVGASGSRAYASDDIHSWAADIIPRGEVIHDHLN